MKIVLILEFWFYDETYSGLSNKRMVWNKHIGWKIESKWVIILYGIIV